MDARFRNLVFILAVLAIVGCSEPPQPDVNRRGDGAENIGQAPGPPATLPPPAAKEGAGDLIEGATGDVVLSEVFENSEAFVFIEGRYLRRPYRLAARGNSVFLNEVELLRLPKAPMPGGKDRYVEHRPEFPVQITAKSSWAAIDEIKSDGWRWSGRLTVYYFSNFPPDEAFERLHSDLKTMPFVAETEVVMAPEFGPDLKYLKVKSKAGDERHFLTGWWDPKLKDDGFHYSVKEAKDLDMRPYSRDEVEGRLRERAALWKEILKSDELNIQGRQLGSIRISPEERPSAWKEIVNVVRILESDLPRDNKIREILPRLVTDPAEIDPESSRWAIVKQLVENFRPDDQLSQRVDALARDANIPLWSKP